MKDFNLSVSIDTFNNKPTKKEYQEMVFKQRNLNTKELYDLIKDGHVFCHNFSRSTFMSFYSSAKNFTSANLFVYDIDHSPLSMDAVMNNILIKPTIGYETLRNCPGDYRFRLLFLLNEPITSIKDYRRNSELFFNKLFIREVMEVLQSYLDRSCFSATQLFVGTDKTKKIVLSDTIITMDILNEIMEGNCSETRISGDTYMHSISSSNYSTTSKVCPKNENQVQNTNPQYDLDMNNTLGTPINNSIYSVNPFNNFFTADITDKSKEYYYVADQNIYSLSTYMKNGKVEVGKRHQTMKYHMIVLKNMYPNITITEMFKKVRWLVNTYYNKPFEIGDDQIYRMSGSILKMNIKTDTGKRKYILNPDYNYLTKSEKIKKFQKCKSEHTKGVILSSADISKNYKELSKEIGFSPATIKKYLKEEGLDLVKMKTTEKFESFKEVYFAQGNTGKSLRELATITGLSKSQVSRYIKKLK